MGFINLEEQFTFHASYHRSTVNRIIHIFSIGPILWSAFVLGEYIPLRSTDQFYIPGFVHPVNVPFLIAAFYAVVYILMDKRVGTIGALLLFVCLKTARHFYIKSAMNNEFAAWQIAIAVQVISWIAQIIGHEVFEGRSLPVYGNLKQTCITAPLFILLDVFFHFGYRPDLRKRIWKNVEKDDLRQKLWKKFEIKNF